MFAKPDGSFLDPDYFSIRFSRVVQATDLPYLTFHSLRHTHATILLGAGVPITVVSKRLGHSSIAITGDVYSHVNAEMASDAAERGAAMVFGGG